MSGSRRRSNNVNGYRRDVPTILLVDPEETLRNLVKTILTSQGYDVVTARDGKEAIKVFSRFHSDISLVLSDVRLPKIAGEDLLKGMRRIDPRVPVLFASAYMNRELKSKLLNAGAAGFIPKPQASDEILGRIRDVLNR